MKSHKCDWNCIQWNKNIKKNNHEYYKIFGEKWEESRCIIQQEDEKNYLIRNYKYSNLKFYSFIFTKILLNGVVQKSMKLLIFYESNSV
jgi:hypothetical protein